MYTVEFYETDAGERPVFDFLMSLDPKMRAIQGNNISRTLFFFYVGKRIIFTNGFIKKTQKTPPKEITLAKARRNDFYRREERKNDHDDFR